MPLHVSDDPLLDTWRGAAALAGATGCSPASGAAWPYPDPFAPGSGALSLELYEEAGVDYLREFRGFSFPNLPP